MTMVEVKVSELIGPALDWAVAKADGRCLHERIRIVRYNGDSDYICEDCGKDTYMEPIRQTWKPSTEWSHGGPLIVSRMVAIDYPRPLQDGEAPKWVAQCWRPYGSGSGESPLIAACRAIVASKLGDTVSVPAELVECGQ